MKLKHIHIDSYKLFHDFDIDFCQNGEVQNLTVITGINGNGKTTLLSNIIGGNDSSEMPASTITTEIDGKDIIFSLPIKPSDEYYGELFSDVIYYKSGTELSSAMLQNEVIRYVDKFVYEKGKTSFEAYSEIQRLIEDIFQGFDLQIRFKGINRDKHLIFSNSGGAEFGIGGLSDGEQQILSKIFPLFTDDMKGRVILIDEPEDSLHPSWQTRFISVLRRCSALNDCQFILATHSPQIISATHKEEIRILVRNEAGNVEVAS